MSIPDLTIDPDYVRSLIVKVRGFMGKEETDVPDDGSDPIDDKLPAVALQEEVGDLSREEVVEEIKGLDPRERAELVALMWLGRDDGDPDDWSDLLTTAIEQREGPTYRYLLGEPLVAEYWLEGLDRLGLGGLVDDVDEIEPGRREVL